MGDGETFERSGNPGYLVGQPILAGKMAESTLPDETKRYGLSGRDFSRPLSDI